MRKHRTYAEDQAAAERERLERDHVERQLADGDVADQQSDRDHDERWLEGSGEDHIPN